MRPKIITIGAYGFTEASFFHALQAAQVDVFCDLRRRRGVRGSIYTFANSQRLQRELRALNIRYLHIKELAPNAPVRKVQNEEDKRQGVAKRRRSQLGQSFIQAYNEQCLAAFNSGEFIARLVDKSGVPVGSDTAYVVALFCVEGEPEACHRSLVARRLAQDLGLSVEHIRPELYTSV